MLSKKFGGNIMSLSDVNSDIAVLAAIAAFDELGQLEFLKKYGFGRAKPLFESNLKLS
jgi:hypothetical protein